MAYYTIPYEGGVILGIYRTNEKAQDRIQEYKDTCKAATGRFPTYQDFYVECVISGEPINLNI